MYAHDEYCKEALLKYGKKKCPVSGLRARRLMSRVLAF